ncbi:MAG: hypothetical protein DRO96_02150 [Candidatus Aenigmatarchaeota archaeon]|nr:MAG: hypothetical protein DRO96_02150 [Candidatus Aenigmarchaeota archaeon]
MPGGDGTGPNGTGGYCTPLLQSGQIREPLRLGLSTVFGRGVGMGTGFGRGFGRRGHRRMFYATGLPGWVRFGTLPTSLAQVNKDQQIKLLEQEKTRLEQELQNIIKRLEELRK